MKKWHEVNWSNMDWVKYQNRVIELEDEGLTTSDAQAVADMEVLKNPEPYMLPQPSIA